MANRVKYSRTPHLPWSQSKTSDDLSWADCSVFEGREVVVTEKIDGECTSIYHDCFTHARSTDTEHHPSRTRIKQLAAQIGFELPEGYRLCGENIYAFHSIFYINLPDYFLAFGIYDKNNFCLPWSDVEEICNLININTVPIIYKGIWDEKIIRNLWNGNGAYPTYQTEVLEPQFPQDFKSCEAEGYVVRIADGFSYEDFSKLCAKYVRRNHVRTSNNWLKQKVVPNLLASNFDKKVD